MHLDPSKLQLLSLLYKVGSSVGKLWHQIHTCKWELFKFLDLQTKHLLKLCVVESGKKKKSHLYFVFLHEAGSLNRSVYVFMEEERRNVFWLYTCSGLRNRHCSTKQKNSVFVFLWFWFVVHIFNPKHQCRQHGLPPVLLNEWAPASHWSLDVRGSWEPMKYTWRGFVPPADGKLRVWRLISKRPGKANSIHLSYRIAHKMWSKTSRFALFKQKIKQFPRLDTKQLSHQTKTLTLWHVHEPIKCDRSMCFSGRVVLPMTECVTLDSCSESLPINQDEKPQVKLLLTQTCQCIFPKSLFSSDKNK